MVHRALVRAGDRAELLGHGEGDQEVGARQEPSAVEIEPATRLRTVALRAVAVAA